jgi:hypothetical protein
MQPPPQPLPTRPLPEAVWEDHLLPMLTCKEAVRLVRTCKALRVVVREHVKDLGTVKVDKLQAALTTFPRARKVTLWDFDEESKPGAPEALVQWLREGGRGGRDDAKDVYRPERWCRHRRHPRGAATRCPPLAHGRGCRPGAGGPPSAADGGLPRRHARAALDRRSHDHAEVVPQLAALGLVRQLPALATLHLEIRAPDDEDPCVAALHPALPQGARIDVTSGRASEVLAARPPRHARGQRGQARTPRGPSSRRFEELGDGLVHWPRPCAAARPRSRAFFSSRRIRIIPMTQRPMTTRSSGAAARAVGGAAGGRVCLPRAPGARAAYASRSSPCSRPASPSPASPTSRSSDNERKHPPDAGTMGLWELMASGGLPALAKLSVWLFGLLGGDEEVRSRVAPALEAVAGTLTHLCLDKSPRG